MSTFLASGAAVRFPQAAFSGKKWGRTRFQAPHTGSEREPGHIPVAQTLSKLTGRQQWLPRERL